MHEYVYDDAGRLAEVLTDSATTAAYTWDGNGNRLSGPDATTTATYDQQDRLVMRGSATYGFSAAGEPLRACLTRVFLATR